jgi:hypothetical protein
MMGSFCLAPLERVDESPWRLTAPGVEDELLELAHLDNWQSDQDRREPVVVGLREELLPVGREQRLLVESVEDADRHHIGPGDPRPPGLDGLVPGPHEPLLLALVADGEGEMVCRFARVGQGQRDPANVRLISHDRSPLWDDAQLLHQVEDVIAQPNTP